ncbi:MAG TPA: SLC13 family permease [Clostridiales bacterium]|nr:SLC13 family permease [Clostridiales bacterium]
MTTKQNSESNTEPAAVRNSHSDPKRKNSVRVALTLLLPVAMVLARPLGMTAGQSFVLGSLFTVIAWWGTGWVKRNIASAMLLLVFLLFGHTPVVQIFNFPLSGNIVMIVAAYLLSEGIVQSGAVDSLSDYLLSTYCKTYAHMVIASFVLCTVLIFAIPQPFPRVVLLAAIYINFLRERPENEERKKVLLFSIFVAATVTSLMFVNGDVIVNCAAVEFGDLELSFASWTRYMTVPTMIASALTALLFIAVFRRELQGPIEGPGAKATFSVGPEGKRALAVTAVVVLLWLTEPVHGIGAASVAAIGVAGMFAVRVLKLKDFKVVSPGLMLFLTAQFAIGRVLVASGIVGHIRIALTHMLPAPEHALFLPALVLALMALHMVMGSVITALSFSIPMLIAMTEGLYSPELIALLVLVSVAWHFLLPFHHVTLVIGFGSGFYENRHVLRFGAVLTLLVFASVFLLYIPWWKLTGLM